MHTLAAYEASLIIDIELVNKSCSKFLSISNEATLERTLGGVLMRLFGCIS
jgi:hypothetical protein